MWKEVAVAEVAQYEEDEILLFKGGHKNFVATANDDVCFEWSSVVTFAEGNEEIY